MLLATGNPPITRKVMETLPEVKFVQRFGAGVNSIDLAAAAELGVIVLNLPGFCAKELADVATAMIMGLIRNTAYYDREVRKGNWPKCQYLLPPDVRELTLGLYGFGLQAAISTISSTMGSAQRSSAAIRTSAMPSKLSTRM